jgi:hypothetical protein
MRAFAIARVYEKTSICMGSQLQVIGGVCLRRSLFQAHPVHEYSVNPLPFYTSALQ